MIALHLTEDGVVDNRPCCARPATLPRLINFTQHADIRALLESLIDETTARNIKIKEQSEALVALHKSLRVLMEDGTDILKFIETVESKRV